MTHVPSSYFYCDRPVARRYPLGVAVRMQFISPVNRVARRVMLECLPWVARVMKISHPLRVYVAPGIVVKYNRQRDGLAFGAFIVRRRLPYIWIAGMKPERSISDVDHGEMLIETFAHELAHYEQWRDGRQLQERGVGVRTRTLVRMIQAAIRQSGGAA